MKLQEAARSLKTYLEHLGTNIVLIELAVWYIPHNFLSH